MGKKSGTKGRYICKVGFYDIYAKDSMRKKENSTRQEVKSTEYVIYHAKKMVEGKFNTKDLAVDRAKELAA